LALALVSVSLLTMAILGAFAYTTAASLLQEISIRQLDALAESKKRDLEKVQEGWRDQLRLIKSRTQLRVNLRNYLASGDDEAIESVARIIEDAATAVDDVDKIRILDLAGKEIVSFGEGPEVDEPATVSDPEDVAYVDTLIDRSGNPCVIFSSLMTLDQQPIGIIEGTFNAANLRSVTANYTGLGETGEVMVVMLQNEGTLLILNPLRHMNGDTLTRMPLEQASSAIRQAVSSGANQEWLNSVDYRGVDVWAATRFLPEVRWGLVVKVDEAEEGKRADRLRDALIDIALALSAFAIVGGTALGFYLARPIHNLAALVERMRRGEIHLRADTSGDDEIAYLGESLNELMDHLQEGSEDRSTHG